jgi:hypothetical protein
VSSKKWGAKLVKGGTNRSTGLQQQTRTFIAMTLGVLALSISSFAQEAPFLHSNLSLIEVACPAVAESESTLRRLKVIQLFHGIHLGTPENQQNIQARANFLAEGSFIHSYLNLVYPVLFQKNFFQTAPTPPPLHTPPRESSIPHYLELEPLPPTDEGARYTWNHHLSFFLNSVWNFRFTQIVCWIEDQ